MQVLALDGALQLGRQRLIGRVHVEEAGVAAVGRHFQRIEQRGARRQRVVGHVGVPDELVAAQPADGLAVLDDARDHCHPFLDVVGQAGIGAIEVGCGDRHAIELAEAGAELHQHVIVDALAGKAQHQMLAPGRGDAAERRLAHRLGQVDAMHVGAERAAGRLDPDFAHGFLHTRSQFATKQSPHASISARQALLHGDHACLPRYPCLRAPSGHRLRHGWRGWSRWRRCSSWRPAARPRRGRQRSLSSSAETSRCRPTSRNWSSASRRSNR